MPPNPERRTAILEAAVDILVDVGAGGVSHRQVDDRAGLPSGTTSNYFRTRLALLEATAGHVVDLHWRHVNVLQTHLPSPLTRTALAALLTRMVTDTDPVVRRRNLARFELFMEGTRRPELRPFLIDLQNAAMKVAGVIVASAGLPASPDQIYQLARLLNGLAFSNVTIGFAEPHDSAELIDRMLTIVLGQ